jgi:hypothetical protein
VKDLNRRPKDRGAVIEIGDEGTIRLPETVLVNAPNRFVLVMISRLVSLYRKAFGAMGNPQDLGYM